MNQRTKRGIESACRASKELGIKHICYSTADGIAEERID